MGRSDRGKFVANIRKTFHVKALSSWGTAQSFSVWPYDVERSIKAALVPNPPFRVSPPFTSLLCLRLALFSWASCIFNQALNISFAWDADLSSRLLTPPPTSTQYPLIPLTAILWVRDNLSVIHRAMGFQWGLLPQPPSYPGKQENVSPIMKGIVWAVSLLPIKQKRLYDL